MGLLLSILSNNAAIAQDAGCTNSWVNPKTGTQECLDGNSISQPSPQNQVSLSLDNGDGEMKFTTSVFTLRLCPNLTAPTINNLATNC